MLDPVKRWMFSCEACSDPFAKVKESQGYDMDAAEFASGAIFCYSGPHTIESLPDDNQQRVYDGMFLLYTGPNLYQEIYAIPITMPMPNVRILVIRSHGCYDEKIKPSLERSMPKLQTLKLIDIAFSRVKLNEELTPIMVDELFMQTNIPDECDLPVLLPRLKSFSMHYYGPLNDNEWIHEMLSTAKNVESFDSYKQHIYELNFVGNDPPSPRGVA